MIKLTKRDSQNRKLGENVRATYRKVGSTCPSDCRHLKNRSCYAMYGYVDISARKSDYSKSDGQMLKDYILDLPSGKLIRHHVSGDFMKPGGVVDDDYIDDMLEAHKERPDIKGWGYTHAWKDISPIKINSVRGLTINASCDSMEDAFEVSNEWPSVVTVGEDFKSKEVSLNGDTKRVVVCPNQTSGLSCSDCRLCMKKDRKSIVAFRVHGTGKAKF